MRGGKRPARTRRRIFGLAAGPLLFFACLLFDFSPGRPEVTRMAAVATLMAVWWITEAIPIAATALVPMIFFPLMGILQARITAPMYCNSTIFLFVGGFLIAIAMEKWGLHKRIALVIIRCVGGGPARIIFGFMAASGFLSMWISNTATAIMMLPIGLAIISRMEGVFSLDTTKNFSKSLMLGIAYACSAGGIATIVGTPPNLSFARIYSITFPHAAPVSFGQWFVMGLPLSIGLLLLIWFVLVRVLYRPSSNLLVDRSVIDNEYRCLGPVGFEEKAVLAVFCTTALLWVFRKKILIGAVGIPGWSSLLPYPDMIDDGSVALAMSLLLFLIPAQNRGASALIDVNAIKGLPWDIVVLFGGGFALAKGFQVSGLSTVIGQQFSGLAGMPTFVMVVIICLVITFLTELTSNTATTEMVLPILASVAVGLKVNPMFLMVPATLSASCAFMMPVATPPNAIVFGSGRLSIADMATAGMIINLVCVAVISVFFYCAGPYIFGIDPARFPAWAG